MTGFRDYLMSTPSRIPFRAEFHWRQWLEKRVLEALPAASPGRKGRAFRRLQVNILGTLNTEWLEWRIREAASR